MIVINCVQKFVDYIIKLYKKVEYEAEREGIKGHKHLFFRGLPDKGYKLIPSVFRRNYKEREIVLDFNHNAAVLGLKYKFPDDIDKMLVYMQEYGLPTRLLDWTIAPLHALYFACNERKYRDARIVILNPWKLWKKIIGCYKSVPLIHLANIKARALLSLDWRCWKIKQYIYEKYKIEFLCNMMKLPFPFIISYDNPRILHQRGAFTIHGDLEERDMEEMEEVKESIVDEIIIEKNYKEKILDELNYLYINHYSIFPDHFGMSKMVERYGSLYNLKRIDC